MSRLLLVGVTGYVGGTVLSQLLSSTKSSTRSLRIDLLVRRKHLAQLLRSAYGERINIIFWTGLDDTDFIEETAAQYDIIVNAGTGFNTEGAKAFVDGLAHRAKNGRAMPWMLHISGCSNLIDPSQKPFEWDDGRDGQAIFDHMKSLDAKDPYPQRTAEITVLGTAVERGVQAVHIFDLADYFVLLIRTVLGCPDRGIGYIPTGKEDILFPTVGRALMTDINQLALNAAFGSGILPREDTPQQKEIHLVNVHEIADELTAGFVEVAQRGWGGEKAVKGTIGQELLGWKPKRQQEAWDEDFYDELVALQEGRRGKIIASCIGAPVDEP
ncbi:hypothetical protein SLS61_009137 [Didymella pomorum]